MSCYDCYKLNPQDELRSILEKAKKAAVEDNDPKVIYVDAGEYKYISKSIADRERIPYSQILSNYR